MWGWVSQLNCGGWFAQERRAPTTYITRLPGRLITISRQEGKLKWPENVLGTQIDQEEFRKFSRICKIHFLRLSPTYSVGGPVVQVHSTLILGYFVWFSWLVWGLDTIPNLGIGQCSPQYATQITSLQNSKSKCNIHLGRFDTILAAWIEETGF